MSAVGVEPRPTASAWSATASCARSAVGSTPRSPPRRPPRPLPKGSSLCQTWQGQLLVGLGSGLTAKWPPFCDATQACTHTHTHTLSLCFCHKKRPFPSRRNFKHRLPSPKDFNGNNCSAQHKRCCFSAFLGSFMPPSLWQTQSDSFCFLSFRPDSNT